MISKNDQNSDSTANPLELKVFAVESDVSNEVIIR